nr:hypothetical protein [Tanacetum cinerariifolium]
MQEFRATVYVHQHSIRFKLDNKKHIVDLETFRNLHICPGIPGQSFDELPFEAEILEFLRFLQHSAQIRTLTDVNINKLFQPWRSFGAVEHKNSKKSNKMYYPRFTKVIVHHFMSKDLSILRRNKLTNEDIRNTKAYKEYYAYASGEAAPKPKASARRKRGGFDSSTTPPTTVASPRPTTGVVTPRLTAAAKGKQPAKAKNPSEPSDLARTEAQQLKIMLKRSRQETHISQHGGSGTDEGTGSKPGVSDVP